MDKKPKLYLVVSNPEPKQPPAQAAPRPNLGRINWSTGLATPVTGTN